MSEQPPHVDIKPLAGWPLLVLICIYVVLTLSAYSETLASMVRTWSRTETFTHGFLIAPISIWLIWRMRESLQNLIACPRPTLLLLTALCSLTWLLAFVVEVNVVQQLAFVAVVVSGIWSFLGPAFARKIAFPLCFLFLAVPMGTGLIEPLMELTADSTEILVRASGVPIYREGMYLTLPTGNWSVVEACSGIRYLIASYTLGLMYAWLSYQSIWRRTAFVVASIVVPIVANSLRAYGIVMIGHLSNMQLATGVDHLLYGWVFFGAVMLLLFWVGSFWAEPELAEQASSVPQVERAAPVSVSAAFPVFLLTLAVAFTGPALAHFLDREKDAVVVEELSSPRAVDTWAEVPDPQWQWKPIGRGADQERQSYYAQPGQQPVGLSLFQYIQRGKGGELVQGNSPWSRDSDTWRILSEGSPAGSDSRISRFDEALLKSDSSSLLVWTLYRVDGHYTTNPYVAKFLEAKQQFVDGSRRGARIYLVTPVKDSPAQARARLDSFLASHRIEIERVLDEDPTP